MPITLILPDVRVYQNAEELLQEPTAAKSFFRARIDYEGCKHVIPVLFIQQTQISNRHYCNQYPEG